jgi:hypothetical protein
MIKYLRRDDTVIGIIKKLSRKSGPSSPLQATTTDIDTELERARIKNEQQLQLLRERQQKRAAAAQGVKNG